MTPTQIIDKNRHLLCMLTLRVAEQMNLIANDRRGYTEFDN